MRAPLELLLLCSAAAFVAPARRAPSSSSQALRARLGDLESGVDPIALGAAVDWDDVEVARSVARNAARAASQADDPAEVRFVLAQDRASAA